MNEYELLPKVRQEVSFTDHLPGEIQFLSTHQAFRSGNLILLGVANQSK